MTVLLDPWSLTWRGDFIDQEQAEAYVERLTNIFDMSEKDCVSLIISDESAELLSIDDVYPLVRPLPEPLWPNRSDVYKLVSALCEKLPKLSQIGVTAVLIDNAKLEPEIDFVTSDRHAAHIHELSAISLVVSERSSMSPSPILSSNGPARATYQFQVSVEEVECTTPPEARTGDYLGAINFRSSLTQCVADWCVADLLRRGFVERAIALSVWKANGMRDPDPFLRKGWSLGKDFERSIGECGIATNRARVEALLRSCSNIVLAKALRTTHALRENSSGNSKQRERERDNAYAWRADVDDEFHVHYWVSSAGIEFANVVTHNNFGIST